MTNDKQDDKELDAYLSGETGLSRRYRDVNNDAPSAHLDNKILAAARAAVETRSSPSRPQTRKARWALPLSVAAIVTLSVSVVLTLQQRPGTSTTQELRSDMQEENALPLPTAPQPAARERELKRLQPHVDEPDVLLEEMGTAADMVEAPAAANSLETEKSSQAESVTEPVEKRAGKVLRKMDIFAEPASADRIRHAESDSAAMSLKEVSPLRPSQSKTSNLLAGAEKQLLADINDLLEQGDIERARKRLSQFQRQYPGYSGSAIRELLGEERYRLLQAP